MEQEIANTTQAINSSKSKSGKGLKIATIIACIIAVCGVGFGIYGMLRSAQKDTKITDLNNEITNLNTKINELENQINLQQDASNQNGDFDLKDQPSIDNQKLTADIQNGTFILKNNSGVIVAQDNTKNVSELISCDTGTATSNSPLKCTAKTTDGKSVWFTYNFDTKELASGYSTINY